MVDGLRSLSRDDLLIATGHWVVDSWLLDKILTLGNDSSIRLSLGHRVNLQIFWQVPLPLNLDVGERVVILLPLRSGAMGIRDAILHEHRSFL